MANEVEIVVTSSQRGDAMARARGDFDKTGRAASRFGGVLKTVGATAAGFVAGALFTGALNKGIQFFGDASDAASDLSENVSKSQAVFGTAADGIRMFAEDAANSLGLSKNSALEATSTFGNMFDQLGMGVNQSSDMSQSITTLAADFASFHNADITDVLDAQSAAFRGEYDSLQRFLPLINAAAVEQQAMAATGKANTSELTQQEKAMATYTLMLEGAGQAQGDFAKTADGAANAERRAAAEMENMRAEIGEKLLPASMKITQVKLQLARVLMDKVLPAFERGVAVIRPFAEKVFGKLAELLPKVSTLFDETRAKVKSFIDGFQDGVDNRLNPESMIAKIQRLGEKFREFLDIVVNDVIPKVVEGIEKLREIWEEIEPDVSRIVSQLAEVIGAAMELVVELIKKAVQIITEIWDRWGEEITTAARIAWDFISGIISGALTIIQGIMQTATAILQGDWSAAWDGIKTILSGAWEIIKTILSTAWESIKETAKLAWGALKALFSDSVNQIKDSVTDKFNQIKDSIGEKLEAAWSLASGVWDRIKSLFTGKADEAKQGVTDALQKIVDWVKGLGGKIASAAIGMFSGITDAFSGVIGTLKSMWDRVTFQNKTAGFTASASNPAASAAAAAIRGAVARQNNTSSLRRRASGGNITGLVEVGEHGKELVDLGAGGRVISNPDSQRMMSEGGGSGGRFAVNDVHFHIGGSILSERDLIAIVRNELNVGGLEGAAIA